MTNKYDPLWELAGQKVALHGVEKHLDSRCPLCHVMVHLDKATRAGDQVECGLCGEQLRVEQTGTELTLVRRDQ